MWINRARNVNQALSKGLTWCANINGATEASRNGPVRVSNVPVMTVYDRPWERVLFGGVRDANPFFHLFESLWMLAGQNDLPWLAQFNSKMVAYSDDGGLTQPAAYGHRWRSYFGYDQIDIIVEELKANPTTRRCVLTMWDGGYVNDDTYIGDLKSAVRGSADVPCNTHCYFRIHHGRLDTTVLCRSNDILWGAHGANAVHFSVLQEYIAARVGCAVGLLYQFSNNYHYYTDIAGEYEAVMRMAYDCEKEDLYVMQSLEAMPMFTDIEQWHKELPLFMDDASNAEGNWGSTQFAEPFFAHVANPMLFAWRAHKRKDYQAAAAHAIAIYASDWRVACVQWIERRALRHREKNNGGS